MRAASPKVAVFTLAVICTALVVIGCVSTWAKLAGVSYKGTDANAGKSTLVAAVLALAFLALATWRPWRWAAIVAAIPAAIAGTIAAYRLSDISNFVGGSHDSTAGWGIWAATIAGIVLFVLCLVHAFLPSVAAETSVAPPAEPPPAA
jgi:hypothetical protein